MHAYKLGVSVTIKMEITQLYSKWFISRSAMLSRTISRPPLTHASHVFYSQVSQVRLRQELQLHHQLDGQPIRCCSPLDVLGQALSKACE